MASNAAVSHEYMEQHTLQQLFIMISYSCHNRSDHNMEPCPSNAACHFWLIYAAQSFL